MTIIIPTRQPSSTLAHEVFSRVLLSLEEKLVVERWREPQLPDVSPADSLVLQWN